MKAKDVPDVHAALLDLSPFFQVFYNTFEEGIDHGKSYFENINESCDLHLHAHIVRYWVKRYLVQHDLNAEEDLTNSGIQLSIKKWFIRIRKASRGSVPAPGRSKKLQEYYQQVLPGDFSDMNNLLLLWNATSSGDFLGLSLVYPLSESVTKWMVKIPHPADSANAKIIVQSELEEILEDDFGDLEIEPLTDDDEDISEAGNQ